MSMTRTMDEAIYEITVDCLNLIAGQGTRPEPIKIKGDIMDNVKIEFDLQNSIKAKGEKWKIPNKLLPSQIALIIAKLYPAKLINLLDDNSIVNADTTLIGVYNNDLGIYVTDEVSLRRLARLYNRDITTKEFVEFMACLREMLPTVCPCKERNLIAVNNGIFDFDTKTLLPFSPDKVFLVKCCVNYNPFAQNITIHNPDDGTDWNIEDWMKEMSDDSEIVNLLWETIGAVVRPNVRWNKVALFYSETGNNGKGTLCKLMREIVGKGACKSLNIEDMARDFALESLLGAMAIVADENAVKGYWDNVANFKNIATHDVLHVNRKYKSAIDFKFSGFMVQCINSLPRVKDTTGSFYRRLLVIPFTRCFTGCERKYIKDDYIERTEVLEYVLYKVLNMSNYELSEPDACKAALEEYKEFNDPVREFANEILPQLAWDLVPFTFLYDLYKVWYNKNCPSGVMLGKQGFLRDLLNAMADIDEWECKDKSIRHVPGTRMDKPEPLIAEYGLTGWMNPMYISSKDVDKKCCPTIKAKYNGIVRVA